MTPLHEHLPDFGKAPDRISAMIQALERIDRNQQINRNDIADIKREIKAMREQMAILTSEYWQRKG